MTNLSVSSELRFCFSFFSDFCGSICCVHSVVGSCRRKYIANHETETVPAEQAASHSSKTFILRSHTEPVVDSYACDPCLAPAFDILTMT